MHSNMFAVDVLAIDAKVKWISEAVIKLTQWVLGTAWEDALSNNDDSRTDHFETAGVNLMGPDLYHNLIQYSVTHLKSLKEARQSDAVQDEALLRYYATEWDRYMTGANYINQSFTYLNCHWVKWEWVEGRKGVYPVYMLVLVQWKSNFFLHVQSKNGKLAGAILQLVKHQWNGESIDQGLVKKVVNSFVSLGLDESDINKASLDVYKEHLATPFLEATEKYYQQESEVFLAESSVSDYLKKVEEQLREEGHVDHYLSTETRKQLVSKCKHGPYSTTLRANVGKFPKPT
ncbi:Cullin repeat-like-containing domain protein [Chiua virens]|nr:Cullin repeat-like-containing domain protein [Chiua virens]